MASTNIVALTRTCLRLITDLCERDQSIVSHNWLEVQAARINLWASNLGVFAKNNLSIVYRLSENEATSKIIVQLLITLRDNLDLLLCTVLGKLPRVVVQQENEDLSDSSNNTSPSISDNSDDGDTIGYRQRQIGDGIGRLTNIARQIRREGAKRSGARAAGHEPLDDDGEPLAPRFEEHIRIIIRRALGTISDSPQSDIPAVIHSERHGEHTGESQYQLPDYLGERLRRTMLDRWRRISYQRHHAVGLAKTADSKIIAPDQQTPERQTAPMDLQMDNDVSKAPDLSPRQQEIDRNKAPPTAATRTPAGFVFEDKANTVPQAPVTVTTAVQGGKLNYPLPPEVDPDMEFFPCPFCCLLQPVVLLHRRQWRSHVMQDLSPYFCIFQECRQPYETFSSSNALSQHIKDEHSRDSWSCNVCSQSPHVHFEDSDSYVNHLKERHGDEDLTAQKLSLLVNLGRQQISLRMSQCLFCGFQSGAWSKNADDGEVQKEIIDHMCKQHMKAFALDSIPWDIPGGGDGSDYSLTPQSDSNSADAKENIMEDETLVLQSGLDEREQEELARNVSLQRDLQPKLLLSVANLNKIRDQALKLLNTKDSLTLLRENVELWRNGQRDQETREPFGSAIQERQNSETVNIPIRLLSVQSLTLTEFGPGTRPKYVVASHRWSESEATYQTVRDRHTNELGYKKIKAFANFIKAQFPSVEWLWIDTCCINQASAAELSFAINSMFEWYSNAEFCIAHLADVNAPNNRSGFRKSVWFSRGWTLQELLAPKAVIFVTRYWQVIGIKGILDRDDHKISARTRLEEEISQITGIPLPVLLDFGLSSGFSIDEKLRWMEGRVTTREEDLWYAMYGILNVRIGANYGEGYDGARTRLLKALDYDGNVEARRPTLRKITAWLSPCDPWADHELARRNYEHSTGLWLLGSEYYRGWKSNSIRHLWLTGRAGCGKTTLMSLAIEDIRTYCEGNSSAIYAMFYFSLSDTNKQSLSSLLRSLAARLGKYESTLSVLQQAYEERNGAILNCAELEHLVLTCIDGYQEVFLMIDALDECPQDMDERPLLLQWLTRLSQNAANVKILASSRDMSDIRASMTALGSEEIPITLSDNDMRLYVNAQLNLDPRLSRLDDNSKSVIGDSIVTKAYGTFRSAFHQLQDLKSLESLHRSNLRLALDSIPSALDDIYERTLHEIHPDDSIHARRMLLWLAYAKSPVSLSELAETSVIDLTTGGSVEVKNRLDLPDPLIILSSLIRTNRQSVAYPIQETLDSGDYKDAEVSLLHLSIKEYLESPRIQQSSANDFYIEKATGHRILCQSCLIYLTHYSNSRQKLSTAQDFVTFPLLRYAADSWFYHSALQQAEAVTREVAFLHNQRSFLDWLQVSQPDRKNVYFAPLDDIGSGLYYASFVGLGRVVEELLSSNADVNAQGGLHGSVLHAASAAGHSKIVQMLLAAGADVNAARGRLYGSAIQAASAAGHSEIVQMLLAAGADVNVQGGLYGTALHAASALNQDQVVKDLLNAGAYPNAFDKDHTSALYWASFNGHLTIVRVLLDAGADPNFQGGLYGNAIQAASAAGHSEIVQTLLASGADVNAQGGLYGNALQAASALSQEQIVKDLLYAGATINALDEDYNSALCWAVLSGHLKLVQVLLDAGADVTASRTLHVNAQQVASVCRQQEPLSALSAAMMDANARGQNYDNALQVAVANGHLEVVRTLLHAGADSMPIRGKYPTQFPSASE